MSLCSDVYYGFNTKIEKNIYLRLKLDDSLKNNSLGNKKVNQLSNMGYFLFLEA